MTDTQFDHLLRPLGIIRTKNDYYTSRQCMTLICTRPDRLRALQKEVYLPVAEASVMLGGLWRALFAGTASWHGKLTWKSAGVGGIPAGSSANGGTVFGDAV